MLGKIITIIIFAALIATATYFDYWMFKRSHPSAGFIEYLWERD